MFQFLSSFGASSNFQKHRLILTSKTYQAPDQISLKKILLTFRGEDQQTRSQIAFATIIKKIHTSDSKNHWIYLLKNLIILDRVVQQNCFLDQIATLSLVPIDVYQEVNQQAKSLYTQKILKSFWKLLQEKCKILTQNSTNQSFSTKNIKFAVLNHQNQMKNHLRNNSFSKTSTQSNSKAINSQKSQQNVLSYETNNNILNKNQFTIKNKRSILSVQRSQKQQFLKTLNKHQLLKQSIELQFLFQLVFKFIWNIDYSYSNLNDKKNKGIIQNQNKVKQISQSSSFSILISQPKNNELDNKNYFQNSCIQKLYNNSIINSQKDKLIKQQFFNSSLAKYLHLQVLYKLVSLYSNQLFCIKAFINLLGKQDNSNSSTKKQVNKLENINIINQQQINEWKKIIENYLKYSQKIINYVQRHKNIKGFQMINYKQLSPFQNFDILEMLDQYIKHKNTLQQPQIVQIQELGQIVQGSFIKVVKKPQFAQEKILTPRRLFQTKRNINDTNNSFYNWQNSYHKNFPPKQVLTVDLIMQIRANPNNNQQINQEQTASIYQPFAMNRHSCIYNYRQSNINLNSDFQFILPLELKNKQSQQFQLSGNIIKNNQEKNYQKSKEKQKQIYFFKYQNKKKQKIFDNIYSKLTDEINLENLQWIK